MSFHLSPLGRVAKNLQRFIFGLSRSVNFTDGRYLAATRITNHSRLTICNREVRKTYRR